MLANELAQKGVRVVALEAGGRYLPEDYVNDEWEELWPVGLARSAHHIGRLACGPDFSGLARLDRQGGGRDHDPLGRGEPAVSGP